jgi:hypothetical protein
VLDALLTYGRRCPRLATRARPHGTGSNTVGLEAIAILLGWVCPPV